MIFHYKVTNGTEVIIEGKMIADNEAQASRQVFGKIQARGNISYANGLTIRLNDNVTFNQNNIFVKPIVKKLQGKPLNPWRT